MFVCFVECLVSKGCLYVFISMPVAFFFSLIYLFTSFFCMKGTLFKNLLSIIFSEKNLFHFNGCCLMMACKMAKIEEVTIS